MARHQGQSNYMPNTPHNRSPDDISEEKLEDIRLLLNPPNLKLVQQILASPTAALGIFELVARNSIPESRIREHLRSLHERDRPIVTSLHLEDENGVSEGIPREYFAAT